MKRLSLTLDKFLYYQVEINETDTSGSHLRPTGYSLGKLDKLWNWFTGWAQPLSVVMAWTLTIYLTQTLLTISRKYP